MFYFHQCWFYFIGKVINIIILHWSVIAMLWSIETGVNVNVTSWWCWRLHPRWAGQGLAETVMKRVWRADTIAAAATTTERSQNRSQVPCVFSAEFCVDHPTDRPRSILIAPVYLRLDTPIPIQTQPRALWNRETTRRIPVKYYRQ